MGSVSKLVAIVSTPSPTIIFFDFLDYLQLCTYPYQLLRSLLQAPNNPYSGLSDCFLRVVHSKGVKGLYAGMVPNIIRQLPPNGCMFLIVEIIVKILGG